MNNHPIKDVQTLDEMRAEINKHSVMDVMTASCMRAADYAGMSGEDRYTLLAYNALKSRDLLSRHLESVARLDFPAFFVEPGPIQNMEGLPKWVGPKKT